MKAIVKTLICITAAMAALTSCKKDDTLQYGNATMGNVVDGTFISDHGNIFTVVEKNTNAELEKMKRAFVVCDVLKKVAETENEYEVRLNGCVEVLTKSPVEKSYADSDEEMSVNDPINIEYPVYLWTSGGYINMLVSFDVKTGSKTKHLVNLVFDKEASTGNQYVFNLRHNSFGESLIYGTADSQLAHNYVSFPITDIIKDNTAEIIINWTWFKSNGFEWTNETQDYSCKMTYTKGGFEQAPVAIASKVTTNLN